MIRAQFIEERFVESYGAIRRDTAGLSHGATLWQPPFGGNCINWIVGHLVVSRCNFLMLLDVPSIWNMDQCRRFMPGSQPVTIEAGSVPFATLLSDLERTQEQLRSALSRVATEELAALHDEWTVAEALLYYQTHESSHAGQIELLSRYCGYHASEGPETNR